MERRMCCALGGFMELVVVSRSRRWTSLDLGG